MAIRSNKKSISYNYYPYKGCIPKVIYILSQKNLFTLQVCLYQQNGVEKMLQVSKKKAISHYMYAASSFTIITQECLSPSQAMFTASVSNKSVVWLTQE